MPLTDVMRFPHHCCVMSNERFLSPQQVVVRSFGGVRKTAAATGCDCAAVSRWGKTGLIPAKYQRRVLETAWAMGLDLSAHDVVFGRAA